MNQPGLTAAIFRRGLKKELFHDRDGDASVTDDYTDLHSKMTDLHQVWTTPRVGYELGM